MALMFPRLARNFVKNGYFPTDEPTLERALTALASAEASAGPLCILDPWRDGVLELLQAKSMLTRLPFALGPLEGHRLAIDVPTLTQVLGGLIRSGALVGGAPASRTPSAQPLEAVA